MKQKIISMLMAIVILMTAVDVTVFASEMTKNSNGYNEEGNTEKKSVSENEMKTKDETTISENDTEKDNEIDKDNAENIEVEKTEKNTTTTSANELKDKASSVIASGRCGENLVWHLENGVLTISGTGKMWDYPASYVSNWEEYKEHINSLVIEEGVTSIGKAAFYSYDFDCELVLPESITIIDQTAFYSCKGLKGELILPESIEYIGDAAFSGCEGFTGDIKIPSKITGIESSVFWFCNGFDGELILHENITSIGPQAFGGCSGLSGELNIPKSVTNIGEYAFYMCSGFTGDLIIPDNVESMGGSVFAGCNGFNGSIKLSGKLENIGEATFHGCEQLSGKIYIPPSIISIAEHAFSENVIKSIYGKLGSYAETYSNEYGITFIQYDFDKEEGNNDELKETIVVNDIEINRRGKAYASFILKDIKDVVQCNKSIVCRFSDGSETEATTDEKGNVTVCSPVLNNTSNKECAYKLEAEIFIKNADGTETEAKQNIQMEVTVLPLSFSQKWEYGAEGTLAGKVGVGAGASVGAAKAEFNLVKAKIEGGIAGQLSVKNEYENGKRNLTLEQQYDVKVALKTKVGPAAEASVQKVDLDFDIISANQKVAVGHNKGVGLKIEDYTPGKTEDILNVGKFLLGTQAQATGNVMLLKAADYLGFDYYNQSKSETNIAVEAGASLLDVEFNNKALGSLATAECGSVLTYGHEVDQKKKINERNYTEKIDANVGVGNISLGGMNTDIFSIEGSCEESVSVSSKSDSTVQKVAVGKSFLKQSTSGILSQEATEEKIEISYSNDEIKSLQREIPAIDSFVKGDIHYILGSAKQEMYQGIDSTAIPGEYKASIEKSKITSVDLNLGAQVLIGAEAGLKLEGVSSYEYDTARGKYANGILNITSQNVIEDIVKEESIGIKEIIAEPVVAIGEKIAGFFVDIWGSIEEGVKNGWAEISGAVSDGADWIVHIIAGDKKKAQEIRSYYISVYQGAMKYNDLQEKEESVVTTVGDPCHVYVTDTEGNEISDYSQNPLSLTLRYTDEMLAAAGAETGDAEKIAVYRYSVEYCGYECVGGSVDVINKSVCLDITSPGQYILAIDMKSPDITSFKVSDSSKTPTIEIGIDEFSGFREFSLKIDGIEAVTTEFWKKYYNKEIQRIAYPVENELEEGVHTVTVYAIDGAGNAMSAPKNYEFVVDTVAPTIREVGLYLKQNQMRIRAWSDDADVKTVTAFIAQTLQDGTCLKSESLLDVTEGYCTKLIDVSEKMVSAEVTLVVEDFYGNVTKAETVIKEREEQEENVKYDLWIAGIPEEGFTYTGKAIKPAIRVYNGTTLLKERIDYSISYKNNTNANDGSNPKTAPTIIITGKENYSGKVTKTFAIHSKSLEHTDITATDLTVNANGKVQMPTPVIKDGTKTLKNKTHYILEYPDMTEENPDAYKTAGEYEILVHGKGNYSGSRSVTFTITDKELISRAAVSGIQSHKYTGNEICPVVIVKYKSKTLTQGMDYTVSYENNTSVGTATVVITGLGDYTGVKRVNFKITGTSIKKAEVAGVPQSMYYTGAQITYETQGWGEFPMLTIDTDEGTKTLVEGQDYTVSYLKNTSRGVASIVFTGINGYTGSLKKNFIIKAYDTAVDSEKQMSEYLTDEVRYEQGGSKPKPVIMHGSEVLEEGKDYTLSYRNNTSITADGDGAMKATVVIKGKGNYSGTRELTFTIKKEDVSNLLMAIPDKVYKDRINAWKSEPKVIGAGGKTLRAGTDYEKGYTYSYKEDSVLSDGVTIRYAGEAVQAEDIPTVGTTIVVTVTGKGNYTGTLSGEYRIVGYDIGKAKVSIHAQIYTGEEITPNMDEITVKYKGQELGEEAYKIVGYSNNIDKGIAKVTLKGIGEYGGTKTVRFRIRSNSFFWWLGF